MKTRICFIALFLFIVILTVSPEPSRSDDSLIADYGKTVAPLQSSEIAMVEEEVTITVDDYQGDAAFTLRRAHVECTFIFKNTSYKQVEATVGFSGNKQNTESAGSYPITDFITVIDRKRYDIAVKKEILKIWKTEGITDFRNWYTWQMKFPADSIVKVENSYYCLLSAPTNYDPFYLHYELATGANWRGPIGKATIRVVYKDADDLGKRVCDISPQGWVRNEKEIVWKFENIKPTEKDNILIAERNLGFSILHPEEQEPLLFRK